MSRPRVSSEVYRLVAGELAQAPRASLVAERIVDDLALRGWPVGEAVGSERSLASRYGVGLNVIRQALRVLEARGLARVRRGPSGGLIVGQSSREQLVRALTRHLRWSGLSGNDIADAIGAIRAYAGRSDGGRDASRRKTDAPLYLILDALQHFGSESSDEFADATSPDEKQALQIAMLLLKEVSCERCTSGYFLGSVPQLSDRYGVDARIFIQAARLVADLGIARVKRGRTGGLFLRDPGCAALVSLVHSQMVAQHLRIEDVHQCLWVLNTIHTRRAAERRATTQFLLGAEEAASTVAKEKLPFFWIQLQQEIAYAAAIPALHVFSRCFAAFGIRTVFGFAPPTERETEELRETSRQTVRAILGGDADAAERAQRRCHANLMSRMNRRMPPQSVH